MVTQSKLERTVKTKIETDEEQAIRLSKEIHRFVQPLLDWYQFKDSDAMCFCLEKICDIEGLNVTYPKIRDLASGDLKHILNNELRWIYSTMRRMKESAVAGRREKLEKKQREIYILPNDEPLSYLIDRALKELRGEHDQKVRENIELLLEDTSIVRKPSGLVQRLLKGYGFASKGRTNEFLADVASTSDDPNILITDNKGIPTGYALEDLRGLRRRPSNYHRKMYVVAAILDYALRKRGLKEKAIDAIIEREQKRSEREEEHIAYLVVKRPKYIKLIRQMESYGLKGYPLAMVISTILSITINNARDIVDGDNDSMDLSYYNKLKEFVATALPNIHFVELSDEKKRQIEYERFLSSYRAGRVPSRILVTYTGGKNSKVDKMVEVIRDTALSRLGIPFIFDQHRVIKVAGVRDYNNLLMMSKYSKE